MKNKISLLVVMLFISSMLFSQTAETKANFLHNFCRMLNWPNDSQNDVVKINIIGEAYSKNEIQPFLEGKEVFGRQIKTRIVTLNSIEDCYILYVPTKYNGLLPAILMKIINTNIIIVTESENMITQGAAISLIKITDEFGNETLEYQYNEQNITMQSVDISKDFKGYGITEIIIRDEVDENNIEDNEVE